MPGHVHIWSRWCQVTLMSGHVCIRWCWCQVTLMTGGARDRWPSWQVMLVSGDVDVRLRSWQVTLMLGHPPLPSTKDSYCGNLLLCVKWSCLSNVASLHLWASFWSYLQNANSFYVGGFMWISDYSPGWDTTQLSSKGSPSRNLLCDKYYWRGWSVRQIRAVPTLWLEEVCILF